MDILISVLSVLAAIVLVLIVLVQNSKGGGLAANFSSSNQIMGVRKTTDFLEKATWGLAGFIILMSIISTRLDSKQSNVPQSEVSAPVSTPVNSATAPDVSGAPAHQQNAPVQQQSQSQQQQSAKPTFPAKPLSK